MSFFDEKTIKQSKHNKTRKDSLPGFKYILYTLNLSINFSSQKRISSKLSAVATVEAALIFPIVTFFFVSVMWFMNLFYIHTEIGAELNLIGNEMTAYSYPYSLLTNGVENDEVASLALSVGWNELYIKSKLSDLRVYDRIEEMTTLLSDYDDKDAIDIVVTYYVKPVIEIPGLPGVYLSNHFYSKLYKGYSGKDDSADKTVYVTASGTVYHTDPNCRALKYNVFRVRSAEIDDKRNDSGSKYYPCEKCAREGFGPNVYITEYGTRYHSSKTCSELKIDIFEVPLSSVGGKPKCRFCGR